MKARIIAANICLAIVLPPVATTIFQTDAQRWSALFVDCGGNYAQVSTTSGVVERRGTVQRLTDARLPPFVRDGCAVHDLKAAGSPSRVVLTVQNFTWDSDKPDPPYSQLTLQLFDFHIVKREPLRKLPSVATIHPGLSRIQRAFIESLEGRPFARQAVMLSSDGRIAVVAELTPSSSSVGPPSVLSPGMRITLPATMPLTGRFAVYDARTKNERMRYEIPGLQTDLINKTLLAPDGSFVFHAHNDSDGRRKLFLVPLSPGAAVVEVAYGDLDPWWLAGAIVSAP